MKQDLHNVLTSTLFPIRDPITKGDDIVSDSKPRMDVNDVEMKDCVARESNSILAHEL